MMDRPRSDPGASSALGKLAGFVIAVVVLAGVYVGYQALQVLFPPNTYETALLATVADTVDADGVLLFDEVYVPGSGTLGYLAADGERVSAGTAVAEIYSDASQAVLRQQLTQLTEQIDLLQRSQNTTSLQLDALLRELSRFAPGAPLRPDTVYFGGGTPSLLTPTQAERLIRAADPVPGAEITLEANPETVTEESLRGFRAAGVNRISFGVQSARDTQLRTLGRPHSAKQARAAFAAARRAGFENISGDIMLALPHYTQAEFDETLELIEKGGATHISAYLLKIEPDSAFGKHPPEGLPTGDEAADFYLYAVEQLEHHGYRQYEISNFAKPGYEGKHNLIYWDCGDYLGLGPAAHSCMGGKRFCYAPDTAAFLQDAAAPIMDGSCGAEDYLILQLRLRKGLDLDAYKALYGKQFSTAQLAFVQNCVRAGYATFDGRILALTPAGLIVQNSILAQLL